jgi:hypothetical protein
MILKHVLRSVTGLSTKCHSALAGVLVAEMFGSQIILLYRTVKFVNVKFHFLQVSFQLTAHRQQNSMLLIASLFQLVN